MSIVFKLKYKDITRRIALAKLPEWDVLAEKLSSVFLIPMANVGVSYVDVDGEEITLSSQQELGDFYKTTYKNGESIRFTVKNLSTTQFMPRDSIPHEFAFHPPPPPFPTGFLPAPPHIVHPYPELRLLYGVPLPPPFPPSHHHQRTQPPSPPYRPDQHQSTEGIGHEHHSSHAHNRHYRHSCNGAFRCHHYSPPLLPPLSVTPWDPHGHRLPLPLQDHSSGFPQHHPHPGPPDAPPHHQSPCIVPHPSCIPGSHCAPPHPVHHRSSDFSEPGTHASTGDAEKSQE